jgi:hypothetical protein
MTRAQVPITRFAPAERVPIEIIRRQAAAFQSWPLPSEWCNSPFEYIFVLNRQRQIVFSSRNLQQLAANKGPRECLGMRFGEALDCIRATETEGGCGTTENCRSCGATQAILNGLAGKLELREFRLTRTIGCRLELRDFTGMAVPLVHNHETYCVFALSESREPAVQRAIELFFSQQRGRVKSRTEA